MSSPTKEQNDAITVATQNVIVSAGAGSGKTFVLKERVLSKVQSGDSINNFIILTFTKKAATEMKDRIRSILSENKVEDAKYVDSAYITTFDSYSHSLVNKYSYLLDIDKNFNIIDSSIVKTELRTILDEILEKKYAEREEHFSKFISDLCYKNDDKLRDDILKIYEKLNSVVNKDEFLNIDRYYEDKFIESKLDEYENNIFNEFSKIVELHEILLEHSDKDTVKDKNQECLNLMNSVTTLDELIDAYPSFKTADNRDGWYDDKEYIGIIKDSITDLKKKFGDYLKYSRKELKEQYISTKEYVSVLKDIIVELDEKIKQFKREHNSYEFADIAFKAIELVEKHEDVRNEIKNNTVEIIIDEYQDTNDVQDKFISLIQNDNVYVVGDVKQSIYGFRNANPKLFKTKYDEYGSKDKCKRIDLTKNFRSREEVINNINDIFSLIMYDDIGGADYKNQHIMAFGNHDSYDNNKDKGVDYNFEILSYKNEDKEFKSNIIEATIIAKDILKKKNENRNVVHGKAFSPINYKDFCILVDKSTNFETLKKVLESYNIPCNIAKGLDIKNDDEIYIIKNLISCLTCIKNNKYNAKFKHSYMSIARSYIYKMDDQDIYDALKNMKNQDFKSTPLFIKLEEISKYIDSLSNKEIIYKLIDEFDIINKTITVGSVDERIAKLEYFIKQADSLNKFGMDIYTMENYFNDVIESDDDDISMELEQSDKDAVTIMTIHGSKGLEFPYVYMPYLSNNFMTDKSGDFVLDNDLGLLLPFYDEGIDKTFMRRLYKQKTDIEILSERIRLFYVAVTRARENFIFITEFNDKIINNNSIESYDLLRCKSFTDFVTLIKPYFINNIKEINIEDLEITKESKKKEDYKKLIEDSNEMIIVTPNEIDNKVLESKHFSKELSTVIDNRDALDLGTMLHYCFEVYDFNNDNLDELNISDEYKQYIKNFLAKEEVKDISKAKIYKEHEIKYINDSYIMSGIIDLLVEYEDHFDIIDYKTSNISKPEYKDQLEGYKEYISSRYNKPVNIYLYSIKNNEFKSL